MKIFLDTSSLFKLYHKEQGSAIVERILLENAITTIFLSEIATVEFVSTVWKKVRIQDIDELRAHSIIAHFEKDIHKFTIVLLDNIIVEQAKGLIEKYGRQGLRTLDSIQLSTAVSIRSQCDLYATADQLLETFFDLESLPCPAS